MNPTKSDNGGISSYKLWTKTEKGKNEKRKANQEIRKGSSKLLKALIIKFSLVTTSICGPGNCPLIKISWKRKTHTHNGEYIFKLNKKMGVALIQN